MKFSIATSMLLAGIATARPVEPRSNDPAAIVLQIAPKSASCASDNSDCRTAKQAGPLLVSALADQGIYEPGCIAGVIALMAYESDEFQYKHNISPGRPGQGTANMQMYNYNLLYAKSIPSLASKAAQYSESASDDQKNALLALVTDDKYNFGSAAWFLKTQCAANVRTQLATGSDAGFSAYMGCVGVTVDSGRQQYWTAATKAFGIS